MGGVISCRGQGYIPAGEDSTPYGKSPAEKTVGTEIPGIPNCRPISVLHTDRDTTGTCNTSVLHANTDMTITGLSDVSTQHRVDNNNIPNDGVKANSQEMINTGKGGHSTWNVWRKLSMRSRKKPFPVAHTENGQYILNHDVGFTAKLPYLVEKTEVDVKRNPSRNVPAKPPRSFSLQFSSVNETSRSTDVVKPVAISLVSSRTEDGTKESIPTNTTNLTTDDQSEKRVQNHENDNEDGIVVDLQSKMEHACLSVSQKSSSLPGYGVSSKPRNQNPLPTGKIRIVSPQLTRKSTSKIRKKSADITAGDRHVFILQNAIELICQRVDLFMVIDKLKECNLVNDNEIHLYRNTFDSRLFAESIIHCVMDKEYNAFIKFCDVLREVLDFTPVVAVLDAMRAVYDVIFEVSTTDCKASPYFEDEKSISFDVVYYSMETGKMRSVIELEKLRGTDTKRHSQDLLSMKRNSRLSFQSLNSEASSVFSEELINNGLPMVTVAISGYTLSGNKSKALATVIEKHSCILELHIGKTKLTASDMMHIGRALTFNSCISVLDLRLNNIGHDGASYVADVLYQNHTLRQLNLSSTGIDADGCKLVIDSLRTNSSVTDLDFSFIDVGDNGCAAFNNMLKQNRCLKKLRLRSDNISWIGCGFLLEGIELGKTLVELDLSRNFIGDTGAEMFLRHMKDDSSLRELNLENCGITAAGCSILSDVILTNKALRNLDLSVNFIGDQGISKLSNALQRNKHIKTLGLNMCGISNDGFSRLLDILESNVSLTMLKLCYNRLGREHTNPDATSDNLKYRIRIVTSSNPKLKLLLWGNSFEDSHTSPNAKEL